MYTASGRMMVVLISAGVVDSAIGEDDVSGHELVW